jgi:hypothetical protein
MMKTVNCSIRVFRHWRTQGGLADVYQSESPFWGKRGSLAETRRVGTVRFMSRSTPFDKGSTDKGAGSGPRSRARRHNPAGFLRLCERLRGRPMWTHTHAKNRPCG